MVWAARGEIEFVIAVYTIRSDIPQSPLALGWLCHNTIDGRSAPAFNPIFHILCHFVFAAGSEGVLTHMINHPFQPTWFTISLFVLSTGANCKYYKKYESWATIAAPFFYQARALRALGLLLADGTPTVGGGKTFWAVSQIFLRKQL